MGATVTNPFSLPDCGSGGMPGSLAPVSPFAAQLDCLELVLRDRDHLSVVLRKSHGVRWDAGGQEGLYRVIVVPVKLTSTLGLLS